MIIPKRNLRRFFYKSLRQPGYALRVLLKRLQSRAYYWLSNGRSAAPEAVTLFLTHRCNLQCKMCGQWGEGGVTKKASADYIRSELAPDELDALIDALAQSRPNITLFGGEPLLYPRCIELIRRIKTRGMHCLMITNGSLLEPIAGEIVESGLDELNVSLDGDAELHDEIRGSPGLFDKIMRGLKLIRDLKKQGGLKKPLVNIQCTVNKYNYTRLKRLLTVARDAGASTLTFHNLIFIDRAVLERQKEFDTLLNCASTDWEGFVFEPGIDAAVLARESRSILAEKLPFQVDFYPNFSAGALQEYYRNPCFAPAEYPGLCLSPWIVAYVFPDGEVRPCLNCSYSFGNIKSLGFPEIWNSQEARRFRQTLKKTRIFPVCPRCTELYRY